MIHAFQVSSSKRDIENLIEFIRKTGEGIFIFPEIFLDAKSQYIETLKDITKNDRTTIISGVYDDPSKIKGYLFAYGDQEMIYHEYLRFSLPDGNNKILTKVRICSEIWHPYDEYDFELLAHPSSVSIDGLVSSRHLGGFDGTLYEMTGLNNIVIASSSYTNAEILGPQGQPVGKSKNIILNGRQIHHVEYDMKKTSKI